MAGAKEKPERIRAFVALDLDSLSLRRVMRTADRLRMASGAPAATWTTGDKMHITLKFAGHLDVEVAVGDRRHRLVERREAASGVRADHPLDGGAQEPRAVAATQ